MEIAIESVPGAVVRLGDIDLADRTFQVRVPAREPRTVPAQQVAALQMRPLLWRRVVPYRILRGFSVLDSLVLRLKAEAVRSWESHRLEVSFLEDAQSDPNLVSAMIAACMGRPSRPFDLSTVECARAMRRLTELGSTAEDLARFLHAISAPRRTQARARALSRLHGAIWESLEEGRLTLGQAESIARALSRSRTFETASEKGARVVREILDAIQKRETRIATFLPELGRKLTPVALPSAPRARWKCPAEVFRLTPKKRLLLKHQNLGPNTPRDRLLHVAHEICRVALQLKAWAGQAHTGSDEEAARDFEI